MYLFLGNIRFMDASNNYFVTLPHLQCLRYCIKWRLVGLSPWFLSLPPSKKIDEPTQSLDIAYPDMYRQTYFIQSQDTVRLSAVCQLFQLVNSRVCDVLWTVSFFPPKEGVVWVIGTCWPVLGVSHYKSNCNGNCNSKQQCCCSCLVHRDPAGVCSSSVVLICACHSNCPNEGKQVKSGRCSLLLYLLGFYLLSTSNSISWLRALMLSISANQIVPQPLAANHLTAVKFGSFNVAARCHCPLMWPTSIPFNPSSF